MTGRGTRVLAAVSAAVLLVALVVALTRTRTEGGDGPPAPPSALASTATTPGAPDPTSSPAPDPASAEAVLTDPTAAADAGAAGVLAAAATLVRGPWSTLAPPPWARPGERPVYVVRADIAADRATVAVDAVIVVPRTAGEALVLRLLPVAEALGDAVRGLDVLVDGSVVDATLDRAGARLTVPIPAGRADGPVTVRVSLDYEVPDADAITDDGGPAGFGLLARSADVTVLGHWLPLLTLPDGGGPMIPWGDVGAFPPAVWSVVVEHDGTLVTGGSDGPCPDHVVIERGCSWARGTTLRDVSAVLYDAVVTRGATAGDVQVRATAAAGTAPPATAQVLEETVAALGSFTDRFGPLAWTEVDTVRAPLGAGAAGMEFPGLSIVDTDAWAATDGGFGTYVIAHEVAHQWFHALVGNSSLADPVVDESLAQYLSVLFWRDVFGDAEAAAFVERTYGDRYRRARVGGLVDEPPAQPLGDFADADAYSPLVYARAPYAWLTAEDAAGEAAVVDFVAALVAEFGLATLPDETVIARARTVDASIADVLERVWLDPDPIDP